MNASDYQHEQDLRAQTRERRSATEAAHVLADFYEQQGQPSRAALWRDADTDALRRRPSRWQFPVDVIVHALVWHRKVAMWLAGQEATRAAVARAFRSSPSWTTTLIRDVEEAVCAAANAERHWPTMAATLRLHAAGALPPRFEKSTFVLGDLPPDSWPICPRHDRNEARELPAVPV